MAVWGSATSASARKLRTADLRLELDDEVAAARFRRSGYARLADVQVCRLRAEAPGEVSDGPHSSAGHDRRPRPAEVDSQVGDDAAVRVAAEHHAAASSHFVDGAQEPAAGGRIAVPCVRVEFRLATPQADSARHERLLRDEVPAVGRGGDALAQPTLLLCAEHGPVRSGPGRGSSAPTREAGLHACGERCCLPSRTCTRARRPKSKRACRRISRTPVDGRRTQRHVLEDAR